MKYLLPIWQKKSHKKMGVFRINTTPPTHIVFV